MSGWVNDCCLMPSEQYFCHIVERISCISMRWRLFPFWTRPTQLVGF